MESIIFRYNRLPVWLLLFILLCGYGYQVYGTEQLPRLIVSEKEIKQETETYQINIKYPITSNSSINRAVERLIQSHIAAFKHDIGPKRISPNWRNELWCRYTTSQYSSRIGSIRFDIYAFTGGAHGNTQVITQTYDFKTGKEIRLNGIFNPRLNYLPQIADRVRRQLTKQLQMPTLDWITTGTAPVAKNYQAFMLTPSGIIFIFQQYQVGPRVAGMPEVELKGEQINDILTPSFQKK
jgi:peptidoglycan-N-acetylglucosamine deacetylase